MFSYWRFSMKCNFHFWNKLEKHFVNIHAISPLVILIIMNSPHSCHFVGPINIFQPSQFDNPDQEAWLTVIEAIGVIYIDINLMINECISQGQCKVPHVQIFFGPCLPFQIPLVYSADDRQPKRKRLSLTWSWELISFWIFGEKMIHIERISCLKRQTTPLLQKKANKPKNPTIINKHRILWTIFLISLWKY